MSRSPEPIGGKRRQGQASYCERTGKRLVKQNHLYLVLDGWSRGYSIHKIDEDGNIDADLRKQQPGVARIIAPVPGRRMAFDAMDGNIFVTTNPRCGRSPSLVYDTEAAALAVGPPLPEPLLGDDGCRSVATDDTLYAFPPCVEDPEQFLHALSSWSPTDDNDDDPSAPGPTVDWRWHCVPSPWPSTDNVIVAYALHPDGRTIFFSAHSKHDAESVRTVSFDTEHLRWRSHGEWSLPFKDQGYFDGMLDVWVGLQRDGSIWSCQVASRSSSSERPDCKRLKEGLIRTPNPQLRAPMATLTRVEGSDAKFCLVECLLRDGDDDLNRRACILRTTTFGLKYTHKGDLQTMNRVSNEYIVAKLVTSFSPLAFWM